MRRTAFLLLAALSLTSCGDGSTEPEAFDPSGSLSFSYGGTISGRFSVAGELVIPGGAVSPVTGAGAFLQQENLALVATHADGPVQADVFSIMLGDARGTGSYPVDPSSCTSGSLTKCRVGIFLPDMESSELSVTPDLETLRSRSFVMITGDITITSYSATRVRGTFRGLAVRGTQLSLLNTITISNGMFDLPIREQKNTSP